MINKMSDKKIRITQGIITILEKNNIYCIEVPNGNGLLKIDKMFFWATTQRYEDTKANITGTGVNKFIKYFNELQ